jgi:hypothetical protein
MALSDLLQSLLSPSQGATAFGQTAGAIAPGQGTGPGAQASTPLSELVVQGKSRPQAQPPVALAGPSSTSPSMAAPPPSVSPQMPQDLGDQSPTTPTMDYNNSNASAAVQKAVAADPAQGGSANPGLYGILPQNLQHGTLRNALGALGDAFLVSGGKAPEYANNMARQQIGNAMAGMDINDPQSVAEAAQRVAATGAPGAAEMSDKLTQQGEQAALRKQYMEYNQDYRKMIIGNRQDNLYNRMAPMALADLGQAKDASDYAARYAVWQQRIKAIDPSADASTALGIPDTYIPGAVNATSGMTNNQLTQHGDRQSAQATSRRDTDVNASARVSAARVSAGSRPPSEAGLDEALMQRWTQSQNGGPPLTTAETALINKRFAPSKTQRPLIVPPQAANIAPVSTNGTATGVGAAIGGALNGGHQSFVNGHVYTDANGNRAMYQNGKWIPR